MVRTIVSVTAVNAKLIAVRFAAMKVAMTPTVTVRIYAPSLSRLR
jgi:hypothetical protein